MKTSYIWRCSAAAVAIVTASLSSPGVAASEKRMTIPGGLDVPVQVVEKISSATANVGDTFAIQAASDVAVNGWVVIAKGAAGQGEVLTVERAGKHGHAGTLGLQMDWIYDADGHKVKLTSQKTTQEGEGKTGESSTVTIISAAFLGIPGLFAHNFVKGKDVELDSSHTLQSFVDQSVFVAVTKKAAVDQGFAPTAGTTSTSTPKPLPSASPRRGLQ